METTYLTARAVAGWRWILMFVLERERATVIYIKIECSNKVTILGFWGVGRAGKVLQVAVLIRPPGDVLDQIPLVGSSQQGISGSTR